MVGEFWVRIYKKSDGGNLSIFTIALFNNDYIFLEIVDEAWDLLLEWQRRKAAAMRMVSKATPA